MYVGCWKKGLIGSIEERLALTACCVCQCHKFWVQIFSVTLWLADLWRPFRYFSDNARIDCCCVMLWSLRLRPPRRHTSTLVREWCFFRGPRRCLKHANSIDLQTTSEWFMSKRRASSRRMTRCVSIMRNRHYCDTVILCSQNLFLTVIRYEFVSDSASFIDIRRSNWQRLLRINNWMQRCRHPEWMVDIFSRF